MVVQAATKHSRLYHPKATPSDKEDKRLDPVGMKLLFRIMNYQTSMLKYDFLIYNRLVEFSDKLPQKVSLNSRLYSIRGS